MVETLSDRMKKYYEERSDVALIRRCPVIIRIDGRSFHTFTKGFSRPYDEVFHGAMNRTLEALCRNIQGCKLGYTQSDEISLFLSDYDSLESDAFFNYRIQKVCSIAASMATMYFNKFFTDEVQLWVDEEWSTSADNADEQFFEIYNKAVETGAMFDARCFNLPREEVTNYFVFRQQDATRNAVQMLGQSFYSHKELNKKTCNEIQEMLFQDFHMNFNDMPAAFKRGVCCVKDESGWHIDTNIPVFTQDRNYIERFVGVTEENR